MRVVVIGATGNAGTSVVRALAADPMVTDVLGIARRLPGLDIRGVGWATADSDFGRADLVGLFAGADAVVHLAWKFQPTRRPHGQQGTRPGRGSDDRKPVVAA